MGIDLDKGGRGKSRSEKKTKTTDVYLKLLIKVLIFKLSFIHFWQEELIANLIKSY